jgi:TetR/AcrR family transcriptional regulator, transcriptional repressor of bet genes
MPKQVDIAAQKQAIAEAAVRVIGDVGLEATRLRDVATAAGVTTGAVTHYFDGKDEVLIAALEVLVRHIADRDTWRVAPGADPASALIAGCCEILPLDAETRGEWRVWLDYWARAIHEPRLAAIHRDHYARITGALAAALIDQAGFEPERANIAADAIVAAVDGLGTRATVEPDQWPATRQRRTLTALLTPLLQHRTEA